MTRTQLRATCFTIFAVLLVAMTASAQIAPRHADPLKAKSLSPGGFVATPVPQELTSVQAQLDTTTLAQVAAFKNAFGEAWSFYVDRRSGGMAMVKGAGIPWVSGEPRIGDMAQKALALIAAYPAFFQVPTSELVLDTRGSLLFGEENQYASVVFKQVINGVPVADSRIGFYLSHGNMVLFGSDRVIPSAMTAVRATLPTISAAAARTALATYLGGLQPEDMFQVDGDLAWTLRATGDAAMEPELGQGWQAHLAYEYIIQRGPGSAWRALVSATTGEVIRFVDATTWASVIRASVYTKTNCSDPATCSIDPRSTSGPGTATETPVTLPFAKLNFAGGACTGEGCFTNGAGAFTYPTGALAVATTLDGKYFTMHDNCGPIGLAAAAPDNLDFGTSAPAAYPRNTDCAPATTQSSPDTGPTNGGAGDTHSTRNTFYHLNLIGAKSRFYLPTNNWLKGVDGTRGPVTVNVNIKADALAIACNAYWDGTSLNFFRVTEGLNCNNTGEIPGVFLHEYGHGLDQNDGSGTAPEGGTGEAMGDTFALLENQQSCLGPGFLLQDPTANDFWGVRAGYGAKSKNCVSLRDSDYRNFCHHNTTACVAKLDADAPNGARSGAPDVAAGGDPNAGTPASYRSMQVAEPNNATTPNSRASFYVCGVPPQDCAGPLGLECHCESQLSSQANFDTTKGIIETVFGGDIYTPNKVAVSGWQYMDRLWYLSRDTAVSGYSATGVINGNPRGTTNGCGATNWFQQYLLVDDDDGNLANGTPHADVLFTAFARHDTACGLASDASNQPSGRIAPPQSVTLSACDNSAPVQLTWNASPTATKYRVLRNTIGCDFGFAPVAVVGAGQTYYEDTEVAPGVSFYYSVQPIANFSNYGFASNCVVITPAACTTSSQAAPTSLTTSATAPNKITLSWTAPAGALSYKIMRRDGGCTGTSPYRAVGITSGATTFDDLTVVGTKQYSYQVVAANTACPACTSGPSNCSAATALGFCDIPPTFGGVTSALAGAGSTCLITVKWNPATASCVHPTVPLTYSVYRGSTSDFNPEPANLIASGITGTQFVDATVTGGTRYHYVVRAVDGFGNHDSNTVHKTDVASGPLTATSFLDRAGDSGVPVRLRSVPVIGLQDWVRKNDASNGTPNAWSTQAGTFYGTGICSSLESDTMKLGSAPTLAFRTRVAMQPGTVGGIVQVATEAGGYTNWTKLTTINYPGAMATGPSQIQPCNGDPGLAAGQPAFTAVELGIVNQEWLNETGALTAFANQKVRIRFLFTSENGTGLVHQGWFLDDVAIADSQLPGSCALGVAGTLALTASTDTVSEAAGTKSITVARTGGSAGTVGVAYATSDGTATAGSDYDTTSGTLVWVDGDTADKTITIPITNDTASESSETLNLTLSSVFGGATLGSPSALALTITDDDVETAGTLQFRSATYNVSEAGPTATITVTRTGGAAGAVSINYTTSDGSANSSDYTTASGTLNWADQDSTAQTFTVAITDDAAVEGSETVNLAITGPTGGATLGSPNTAVLTINDNDSGPVGTLQFSAGTYSVGEAGPTATITVTRTGGSAGAVGVTYATSDGSATSPADFTATTGSLSWPDSDATPKTFTVAINDDSTFEGDETVNLTLSNATGGAALGSPGTATLTIVENDPAPASTLQFSAPSYGVGEGDGTVTITVNRSGSSSGAVGVSYATSNSTADGSDYTSASGTLSWGDGDTVGKTFTVAITDDASNESAESFNLALSSPTGGASLGSQSTASVTIVDNDTPPAGTLQFSAPTYSVGEAGGTATITVTRTGGSGGAVSVNYATSNGTATAGADYTAASGTLSWANGDTAPKTFTVGISPDTIQENDETVNLGLGGATGGATLGSQKTAVLTIVDDDNPIVINSISPSSICQGGPDFTLTVDGSGFDSGSIVQINGAARLTTFVDAGRLTAIVRASDIASPGSVAVRVANTNGATSNPAALTVNADTDTPVVTPPAAITVLQSMCSPSGDGASGNTSSTVAAFLVAGSATDGCTTTTTRLQPQAGGTDLSNASVFQSGTTQVTFRFRDNAGHVGTAMSSITVRLLGDLNLDGDVDATDLVIMANDLVGNLTAPADVSDVNRDRSVDAVDFVIEANHLVGNIDCLAN